MSELALDAANARSAEDSEWRALVAIAIPVVVVQVGMMLMGVVDTLMVGHLSPQALAAAALGNLYYYNVIVLGMGTLMALDPLVSQAVGARDPVGVRQSIQRGLILAVVVSALSALPMIPATSVLRLFRQPADVVPATAAYVRISIAGVLPFLMFVVLRQSLQALGHLRHIVITIVVANVLNAVLDWVLIFGHMGLPALGVTGTAIATAISRWAMFLVLLAFAWRDLRPYVSPLDRESLLPRPLSRMLLFGLPIGVQQFLEISAFGAIGLLTGTLGAIQVAAYQIALNLAALTFMVPLGVAAAASVRVGNAVGAGDAPRARRAALLAYTMGAGFMATTAVLFLAAPRLLASLYTSDPALIAATVALIPIAGVFQIFDGSQTVGAGVLRGLGDTRVPLVAMLSGYWLVGVPVSVLLGLESGMGPQGLWWGFVAGLTSVATFLLWRVLVLFRRGVERVVI